MVPARFCAGVADMLWHVLFGIEDGMGRGSVGIKARDVLILRDGFGRAAGPGKRAAEIMMDLGRVWAETGGVGESRTLPTL